MDTTIAEVKLPEPVFQSEGGNVSLYHFPEHQCYSLELKGMVPVPHWGGYGPLDDDLDA